MKVSELLPPKRVREISKCFKPACWEAERAINAAAPEIARAVLEWAAKQIEGSLTGKVTEFQAGKLDVVLTLRKMVQEIEP